MYDDRLTVPAQPLQLDMPNTSSYDSTIKVIISILVEVPLLEVLYFIVEWSAGGLRTVCIWSSMTV